MEVSEVRSLNPPPGQGRGGGGYTLPAGRFSSEDILFCVDVGPETMAEMKVNGPNGRPYTRLDSIKQAILLFVHAKLSINPDHRFAFSALSKTTYWLRKEFSSEVDSAIAALRGISVDSSSSPADLSQLFKVANHEAKKSRAQNRIFRVILLYCRSSMPPQYQLPPTLKLFTLDVMYLHDKPGPENCPQMVYDSLIEALEQVSEYEGYIFENGQGLTRALFRHICVLLSHPQQRCIQDDLDIPKPLVKKSLVNDTSQGDDNAVVIVGSSQ
ncbi:BRISC and BRCA1-A complex member 1 [Striga asiatica]|uniref:BRISC and BRCA1-A complex member 1 n=1 Tax=Striga asiatica TaxID=4170 RepID=A0A5A7NZ76_STRAF|nr:BRISC and BRCA1-A complex member 1 [Striga asiatica]